jgi:hypothetical protein
MKFIPIFFLAFIFNLAMAGQHLDVPQNYFVVDSIRGDLDNDGKDELVVAYNMQKQPEDTFESVPRELIIYKLNGDAWSNWKSSKQALYGSHDGGMMGDPYGEMEIQNGILSVFQSGGSSWKWSLTDKYRYQDGAFFLIGYESYYGKPCEHWTDVDFNLMTGKLVVKKEYENCDEDDSVIYKEENETVYKSGLKITLEKRNNEEITILTRKYGHEIYISNTN